MKIDSVQPNISYKGSVLKNIKHKCALVVIAFSAFGYVAKDVFVPRKKVYVNFDGKLIDERDLPSFVSGPSDCKDVKFRRIKLYDSDIKAMQNMTYAEKIKRHAELVDSGRYTLEEQA